MLYLQEGAFIVESELLTLTTASNEGDGWISLDIARVILHFSQFHGIEVCPDNSSPASKS